MENKVSRRDRGAKRKEKLIVKHRERLCLGSVYLGLAI